MSDCQEWQKEENLTETRRSFCETKSNYAKEVKDQSIRKEEEWRGGGEGARQSKDSRYICIQTGL